MWVNEIPYYIEDLIFGKEIEIKIRRNQTCFFVLYLIPSYLFFFLGNATCSFNQYTLSIVS